MWWQRQKTNADEGANTVSFRRVGAIRPVGPDGAVRAYTTRDLRRHLATLTVTLTAARKTAAVLPLVIALAGWFVIPSYAAAPRPGGHVYQPIHPRVAAAPQGPISSGPISVIPQGPISSGPISVVPPTQAGTPVTGAGDGIMRTSVVGFSLLLAGLVLISAPRRNPHAEAIWRETHTAAI